MDAEVSDAVQISPEELQRTIEAERASILLQRSKVANVEKVPYVCLHAHPPFNCPLRGTNGRSFFCYNDTIGYSNCAPKPS